MDSLAKSLWRIYDLIEDKDDFTTDGECEEIVSMVSKIRELEKKSEEWDNFMKERNCQCDACKLVRNMQKQNHAHYLCKFANHLTKGAPSHED